MDYASINNEITVKTLLDNAKVFKLRARAAAADSELSPTCCIGN